MRGVLLLEAPKASHKGWYSLDLYGSNLQPEQVRIHAYDLGRFISRFFFFFSVFTEAEGQGVNRLIATNFIFHPTALELTNLIL